MGIRILLLSAALFVLVISMEITFAQGKEKGDGNENDNEDEKGEKAVTHYKMLEADKKTGQERGLCQSKGRCNGTTLTCPSQCPYRKPKKNKKHKGCFINCSKCETTCKKRIANCDGYGSVCYDPRFVGGDGVMFYFHGATGGNFALVSDDQLQINAHFIGTRPSGRTRDFTWVQALGIMFDTHTLVISAKRITKWNDNVDAVQLRWDGKDVMVPADDEGEWRIMSDADEGGREVIVERTAETNSIKVTIAGLLDMDVKVAPIGEKENIVHNYQLPKDDAFAHLEAQFRFTNLTEMVDGVLGKTYRPNYTSPVKTGVPMPMMGGEDKYHTPSLLSPLCSACRFRRSPPATNDLIEIGVAQY